MYALEEKKISQEKPELPEHTNDTKKKSKET